MMTTATADLITTGKEAKDNATKLVSSLKNAYELAKKAAQEQVEQRPYVTLGVAASAGFVVSSGTKLAALKLFDLIVETKEEK
jgi:ElaB/YqjD/DUF883 family membrane-anchored ribosome-binding protein